MPASQDGASGFKLTAEERYLSHRASSQKDRSLQSKARQASQASSSQVFLFHQNFLHFHHFWIQKEASDMLLAVITGYADALRRPSTWYLTILENLQPKAGQAKMEEVKKFPVRI
jgi:hypothetical protein